MIAFRRPKETKALLDVLAQVPDLAVTVFVDKARTEPDKGRRRDVMEVIHESNARILEVLEPGVALGCRRSVESAVTTFLNEHGSGLILEDDLVPSFDFFDFGFWALREFVNTNAMMVSGRNELTTEVALRQGFEITTGGTWGWGTWLESWEKYSPTISAPTSENLSELSSWLKNLDPLTWNFLTAGLDAVNRGTLDTWDFQWAMSRLQNNGVSVNSPINLVENVGNSTQSTHNRMLRLDTFKLSPARWAPPPMTTLANGFLWPNEQYVGRKKPILETLTRVQAVARAKIIAAVDRTS